MEPTDYHDPISLFERVHMASDYFASMSFFHLNATIWNYIAVIVLNKRSKQIGLSSSKIGWNVVMQL